MKAQERRATILERPSDSNGGYYVVEYDHPVIRQLWLTPASMALSESREVGQTGMVCYVEDDDGYGRHYWARDTVGDRTKATR